MMENHIDLYANLIKYFVVTLDRFPVLGYAYLKHFSMSNNDSKGEKFMKKYKRSVLSGKTAIHILLYRYKKNIDV